MKTIIVATNDGLEIWGYSEEPEEVKRLFKEAKEAGYKPAIWDMDDTEAFKIISRE